MKYLLESSLYQNLKIKENYDFEENWKNITPEK